MRSHFVHRLPSWTSEAGGRCELRQQRTRWRFALIDALEVSAGFLARGLSAQCGVRSLGCSVCLGRRTGVGRLADIPAQYST